MTIAIAGIGGTTLFCWVLISLVTFDDGYKSKYGNTHLDEPRTKTNWNAFALILNSLEYLINVDWRNKFTPKSTIDKEIAETEKEIFILEKHKEKMDTLAELERRKERLFKDVHGVEEPMNPDQIVYGLKTCDNCGVEIQARAYINEKPNQYYCYECESWVGNGTVKSEDKFYFRRWSND